MNYIEEVIDRLSETLPSCDLDLIKLYALLALTRGSGTTLQDVHDAWSMWRNETDPNHRSLVPFSELTWEVQEMDRKYMEAIHCVAGQGHSIRTARVR